jgi:hypothetical protein
MSEASKLVEALKMGAGAKIGQYENFHFNFRI